MKDSYKTVAKKGVASFTVQKSRFIGLVDRVENEAACKAFIEECKEQYPQARHYCSAWIIGEGGIHKRADDDREPQGTAGLPMLALLEGRGITNVCCVAVRYFGGVLLGTGGLARAYSHTAAIALNASGLVLRVPAIERIVRLDYGYWGSLQYKLETAGIPIADIIYTEQVEVRFYVEWQEIAAWDQEIASITAGTALVREGEPVWLNKPLKGDDDE
jgi:uncharacterized YigZ family protein